MPGNGFGFMPYPQRKSVDPREVGMMLAQQGMMGGGGGPGVPGVRPDATAVRAPRQAMALEGMMPRENPFDETEQASIDPFAGPDGGDQFEDSAIQTMRADAKRRTLGRLLDNRGQQQLPAPPFNDEQLTRVGLSEAEKRLMRLSGGIK